MKWIAAAIVAAGALIAGAVFLNDASEPAAESVATNDPELPSNLIQGEISEQAGVDCSSATRGEIERIRFFDNEDRSGPLVELSTEPPELHMGMVCFKTTLFAGQVPEPPSGNYLVERQTGLGSACTVVGLYELEQVGFRWKPEFDFSPGQVDCADYHAGGGGDDPEEVGDAGLGADEAEGIALAFQEASQAGDLDSALALGEEGPIREWFGLAEFNEAPFRGCEGADENVGCVFGDNFCIDLERRSDGYWITAIYGCDMP